MCLASHGIRDGGSGPASPSNGARSPPFIALASGGNLMRMTLEGRVQRLEDRVALEELVSAYCRGADSRDPALFESVWHENAVWDVGNHVFRGHEEIAVSYTHLTLPTKR